MINSSEIHQSVIDADDLEDVRESEISVADVFRSLIRHPFQIIHRWNWKSASMGAMLRAIFYLFTYKAFGENWLAAFTAMVVEFSFRFFTSGISGSLVQSFRKATPMWLATFIVTVSLPTFSHTVEYFTHYFQELYFSDYLAASENRGRQKAFAISVLFSVLSAMFNIYIMRNGVLLVGAGEESKSFAADMKQIPWLIFEFVTYLPLKMIELSRRGNIPAALGILLSFGLVVGGVLGFFRGKWSWAYATAIGSWVIMLVWTIMVGIGLWISNRRK